MLILKHLEQFNLIFYDMAVKHFYLFVKMVVCFHFKLNA